METKERPSPAKKRRPPAAAPGKARGTKSGTAAKLRQTPKKTEQRRSPNRKTAASGKQTRHPEERQTRRPAERQPSPDVVYVQPTPFNKGRFVLCIGIAVAVVLAIIFGMAIFFKVGEEKILVSGTNKYTAAQIVAASGIKPGDNLLLTNEAQITSRILDELRYVDSVRVGIKLPDTVKIEIVELEVVYSVEDSTGGWWLLRSDGRVIEKTNSAEAQQHTQILGIQITEPVEGEPAQAWEEEESSVYPSEKLDAACTIVQYLEEYGVIGELTSVDVANIGDIQLKYGEKYKILLGDTSEMSAKIRTLSGILQSGTYETGILDITSPDHVEGRTLP